MKYIQDASVAFKALLVENHSDKARQLIEDYRNGAYTDASSVLLGAGFARNQNK